MNRRLFLKSSVFGTMIGSANSELLSALPGKDNGKSVILIHMQGGISAVDFINPLPEGLSQYRSGRGYATTKSGFHIGADFTELAKLSEDFSVVRGLRGFDANHASATINWMTGHKAIPNNPQKEPSFGSIYIQQHGTVNKGGVPHYVKLRKVEGDDAAWMGIRYAGVDVDDDMVKSMELGITDQRFARRLSILNRMDAKHKISHLEKGWSEVKEQAAGIINGSASQAFKIEDEDEATKSRYGTSRFGKDLLLARRLIENGSKFISLTSNAGWDNHSGVDAAFERNAHGFDIPLSVLIKDLKQRGMLDDVMIVTVSEFSRTKLNLNAGRDHSPRTNSSMIIGGGYNHGRTIGKTDKTGLDVVVGNYQPRDLAWTILDHLGVDKKRKVTDHAGRPRHLIHDEARNILS